MKTQITFLSLLSAPNSQLKMIDTHCHLWDKKYSPDELDNIVSRAKKAHVKKMLVLGCNIASSKKSLELAMRYHCIFAALGTHPSDAPEFSDETISIYRDLIGENLEEIKAIGEIGLDYHYLNINKKQQWKCMTELIGLAQSVSLPIVVHCRDTKGKDDAYKDCLDILDDAGIKPVVFHCFSGTVDYAEKLLERGFMMSFTGTITYPNAEETRKVVRMCPLENMMVETDSPYLSPQHKRGDRNEPAYVVEVVSEIARIKEISFKEGEHQTELNAEKFFNL